MFKLKKKRAFISYSSTDHDVINKVKQKLENNSITVIIDSNFLDAGDNITDSIRDNIKKCGILILALSKESIKSKWVELEYHFALAHCKKIIPVLLKGADQKDIPVYLQNTKNVDLRYDIDESLNVLIEQLKPSPFWISLTGILMLCLLLYLFIPILFSYIVKKNDMTYIEKQQMNIQKIDDMINSKIFNEKKKIVENGLQQFYYDQNNSLVGKDIYEINSDNTYYILKYRNFYDKNNIIAKDIFEEDFHGEQYKKRTHYDEEGLAFIQEYFTKTGQLYKKGFDKERNGIFVEKRAEFTSKFPLYYLLPFYR